MGRLDHKTKLDIVMMYKNGLTKKEIKSTLESNGRSVTRHTVDYWIRQYENGRFDEDAGEESTKTFKVVSETDADIIVDTLTSDPYSSSNDVHKKLKADGATFSLSTTKREMDAIGFTNSQPRYAQMIREPNKVKRVNFCETLISNNENFDNYIFSDESTIQLHDNKTTSYKWKKKANKALPKPKHPLKLHVWGAISRKGGSQLKIFKGIMDRVFFTDQILEGTLLPFIRGSFPESHRFQQDNDPKHTSKRAKTFMLENGINWVPWPAESPDINPIEMVWNQMKRHIAKIGPRTEDELKKELDEFWSQQVTPELCNNYIDHLYKAVPVCVLMKGEATGDVPNRLFRERSRGKSIHYFQERLKSEEIDDRIQFLNA